MPRAQTLEGDSCCDGPIAATIARSYAQEPRPIKRYLFSLIVAFALTLIVLRIFRNPWASRTFNKITLGLFLYAAIILSLGVFEIVRRVIDGDYP